MTPIAEPTCVLISCKSVRRRKFMSELRPCIQRRVRHALGESERKDASLYVAAGVAPPELARAA